MRTRSLKILCVNVVALFTLFATTGCEPRDDSVGIQEVEEMLVHKMMEFESGNLEAALIFWELRNFIGESDELAAKYSRSQIFEMLERAATGNVPLARYYRFLASTSRDGATVRIEDLEFAYQHGVEAASLTWALVLAHVNDRREASIKVAEEYFIKKSESGGNSPFTNEVSMADREAFMEVLRARVPFEAGKALFASEQLQSVWNTWNLIIWPRLQG